MKNQQGLFEIALPTLALVISIASAVFTWQQVDKHNHISVKPLLQITPYAEGKAGKNGIYLSNVGLGPAIISGFTVASSTFEVSGFSSDRWVEILRAAQVDPMCFATGWPREGATIKAGDELPLISLTKAGGAERCYAEMIKLMGGAGVKASIEYHSVYEDVQKTTGSSKVNSATLQALYHALSGK